MTELKATVCLQGKDIEVISSHIEFNRKTDNKGRPVTNVIGGRITVSGWANTSCRFDFSQERSLCLSYVYVQW